MKAVPRLFSWLLAFVFSINPYFCAAQDYYNQESDSIEVNSTSISRNKSIPSFTFGIKSQFPVQHAIGIEFSSDIYLSGYVGLGILSRAYTLLAMEMLPKRNANEATRKQFLKDKMQNGSVFELGVHYHFVKWNDVYAGLNLQFQKFTLSATPQELVEKYDFGNSQGLGDDLQELLDENERARYFYETTILKPVIRPVQLGITIGKRYSLKKVKRLSINTEFSYQFNITTNTSVESESLAGRLIVNQIINPILATGSSRSFDKFNPPTFTLRFTYQLGNKTFPSTRVPEEDWY